MNEFESYAQSAEKLAQFYLRASKFNSTMNDISVYLCQGLLITLIISGLLLYTERLGSATLGTAISVLSAFGFILRSIDYLKKFSVKSSIYLIASELYIRIGQEARVGISQQTESAASLLFRLKIRESEIKTMFLQKGLTQIQDVRPVNLVSFNVI